MKSIQVVYGILSFLFESQISYNIDREEILYLKESLTLTVSPPDAHPSNIWFTGVFILFNVSAPVLHNFNHGNFSTADFKDNLHTRNGRTFICIVQY